MQVKRDVVVFVTWMACVMLLANAREARAQRTIHACGSPLCDEMTIYANVIDTLVTLSDSPACRNQPPRVLRTLYLMPFRLGRSDHPDTATRVLESPALGALDDYAPELLWVFWPELRLVDTTEVVEGLPSEACLIILSTVTWLGPDAVRVVTAEHPGNSYGGVERFFFLQRNVRKNGWIVTRVVTGWQH